MEQPDQPINSNMELIVNESKPVVYNKAMLLKLYVEDGLSAVEIADLYDQKHDVNKIKKDIKKWQLNTKFFVNHSITQKFDAKYDHYSGMIKSYSGANKFQAKYRELTNVVQEMKKMMEQLKELVGSDLATQSELDTKAILATVEAIMKTSNINVVDIIKIQQKDQDTMIKLNAMQDAILDKLMDARAQELRQVDMEKILNALYGQIKVVETQTGMVGLSHNFRLNVRKAILKVTGSKTNILKKEEDEYIEIEDAETGVKMNKIQLKQVSQIMKEKGLTRKEAWAVVKELDSNAEANKEEIIQKIINNKDETTDGN